MNMGLWGKTIGESKVGRKVAKRVSNNGVGAVGSVFEMLGKPSIRGMRSGGRELTQKQFIRSGQRRAAGAAVVLGLNARIGPSGSRSTGGTGQLYPRSTGGYA